MEKRFSELNRIDNNEAITSEAHYDFLYHLQSDLLMALREQGRLSITQHRHAEEKLRQRRKGHTKDWLEKGDTK